MSATGRGPSPATTVARREPPPTGPACGARRPVPGRGWRRLRVLAGRADGQATVEAIAVLPLLVLVALAAGQALAARSAAALAGGAAQAGAVAMLQDRDATQAARAAIGGPGTGGATIRVDGARVTVRVRPRSVLPAIAGLLTATASADAGPEAP